MAKKEKLVPVPVPQTRVEAETLAETLAARIRCSERRASEAADRIAAIKADLKRSQETDAQRTKRELAALAAWVTVNRGELLTGERKSAQLGAGTVGYRSTPPKIEFDDEEMTVIALEELGRTDLLRTVTEIDREALKADPEAIGQLAGVRVTTTERFFFKPLDVDSEIQTSVKVAA